MTEYFSYLDEGIIIINHKNEIILSNDSICSIFSYNDFLNKQFDRLPFIFYDKYQNLYNLADVIQKALHDKIKIHKLEVGVEINQSYKWLLLNVTPIEKDNVIIISVTDITELKTAQDRIEYLAQFDILTGLPNRMLFKLLTEKEISRSLRNNSKFALLLMDLDNFKMINDTFGHQVGDEFLKIITNKIQDKIRSNDIFSRLAGDEFAFILSFNDIDDILIVLERIMQCFKEPFYINDSISVISTASIGVTISPTNAISYIDLVKQADIAMYHAKNKGKNNYQFYNKLLEETIVARRNIESELRSAIINKELIPYYHPIYDLKNNIIYIEALLRWNHPQRGVLRPAVFLYVAEDTDLIFKITNDLFRQVFQDLSYLKDINPNIKIGINIPATYFKFNSCKLIQILRDLSNEFNQPLKNIVLEITENSMLYINNEVKENIINLTKFGVSFALDDFGTGYNNLSLLNELPIEYLKIDRTFINNLGNKTNFSLVRTMCQMGDNLNIKTIIEGVETIEQFNLLKKIKIDYFQGFLFSKPLEFSKLKALLIK